MVMDLLVEYDNIVSQGMCVPFLFMRQYFYQNKLMYIYTPISIGVIHLVRTYV